MDDVTVIKRNHAGEETWRYPGKIVDRGAQWIKIEAFFNRDDMPFHGMVLGRGDRFVETFYADRWYNVFEIHARETDELKGWYCNLTRPAEIGEHTVAYDDLALDLLVFPDHRQLVLDEDEYHQLQLAPQTAETVNAALRELQALFARIV